MTGPDTVCTGSMVIGSSANNSKKRGTTKGSRIKSQRNTATAITVVHSPFLSPWADWQTCLVRIILPLAL